MGQENEHPTVRTDGGKFSIGYTTDNRPVIVVNDNILSNAYTEKEIIKEVKKSLDRFKRIPIKGQSIFFVSDTKKEYTSSKYSKHLKNNNRQMYEDKMRVAGHPQDIIYATTGYINEERKHERKDNIVDFARGYVLIDVSGRQYTAEVVIGFTKSGICELHDIVEMTPSKFEYKKMATPKSMDSYESARSDATINVSISNPSENVNTFDEKIWKMKKSRKRMP